MRNLRNRPVGQKITFVIMLISGVVLLLASAALFCFQAYTLRQHFAHELAVVGEITAHNCAAAVMFKDEGAAAQILNGLKTMPQIVSARLEVTDQQRLAYFGGLPDELEIKAARLKSGFQFDGNRILLAQPVMLDGKREGTLHLVATSQTLRRHFRASSCRFASSRVPAFESIPPVCHRSDFEPCGHSADDRPPPRLFCAGYEGLRRRGRGVDRRLQPDADANPVSG